MTDRAESAPEQVGWLQRNRYSAVAGTIAVVLIVLIGVILVLSQTPESSSGREIVILVSDSGFDPKSVEVGQGDTLVFESVGGQPHWPASNIHPTHRAYPNSGAEFCGTSEEGLSFDACKSLMPGETFSFTFNFPGEWRFHDHLNPQFTGKVNVLEVAGVARPDVLTGPTEEPQRVFDDTIPEDSTVIWRDEGALYSYVRKYGAAKTIQYLYELQSQFGDCHNNAHNAGRFAYEISDAQAFQTCSAECHSGCYHGATESYFRDHGTTNLAEDLSIICSSDLNPFFSHQCFHGVGHGLMAWSDYEIFEALANCDLLPEGQASCYSGVYMENVVGGLASGVGHYTEYLNEDPHYPCNIVPGKYIDACYFYQTSRMLQLFEFDFARVADACAEIDADYQRSCFESMGRDVGGVNQNDITRAIDDCATAPAGDPRIWCLNGAVQNTFWDPTGQDVALEFCAILVDPAEKASCYETIIQRAPLVLQGQADLEAFCLKAEDSHRGTCLQEIAGA